MNKIKKVSVGTLLGLAIFGTTVFASTGKVYNTSQGLVLRGGASKTSAPLATVPNDKEFEIVEDLGEWYKVKVDGKEGYLFAQYVKVIEETPVEQPPVEPPENNEPNENPNTTKSEAKIYSLPLITSSKIGTIPENTELKIEKTLNNWAYVSYNNVSGWIRTYNYNFVEENNNPEVKPENPEETPAEKPEEKPEENHQTTTTTSLPAENTNLSFTKGYINGSSVNVRQEPNTNSKIVTTLIRNTGVTITAQTDEWYKITYGDYVGYIYKPLISETPTVTNRGNEVRQPEPTVEQTPVAPTEEKQETTATDNNENVAPVAPTTSNAGEKVVSFAKQYLGYRYVYGGTKPSTGFDCTGFTYYVFTSCGYSVGRSCSSQLNSGTAVTKAQLQPGDLLFFNNTSSGAIGHVGIYIGGGRMIHAANSKRGVVTDTINSGYYNTYYYTARRIAK